MFARFSRKIRFAQRARAFAGWLKSAAGKLRGYLAPRLDSAAALAKTVLVWLFVKMRGTPLPWLVFLLAGALAVAVLPLVLRFLFEKFEVDEDPLKIGNIWTFLAAAAAAPLAWYVFFIRDHNISASGNLHQPDRFPKCNIL